MVSELRAWLIAFFFTQLFEMPLYWRASRSLFVAFMASALTHPIVWFCFPLLGEHQVPYWAWVTLAELFAVVVEAKWLEWNRVPNAWAWSFGVNAFSVSAGFALRHFTGWV